MEGPLWKEGAPGLIGTGFRDRYFVLNGPILSWLDRKGGVVKGSVDITGSMVEFENGARHSDTQRYRFTLSGRTLISPERPKGEYVLEADTAAIASAWVTSFSRNGARRGGTSFLLAANSTLEHKVAELEGIVDTLQPQLTAAVARQSAAEAEVARLRAALAASTAQSFNTPLGGTSFGVDGNPTTLEHALSVAENAREALRAALTREAAADAAWRARDSEWRGMVEALAGQVAALEAERDRLLLAAGDAAAAPAAAAVAATAAAIAAGTHSPVARPAEGRTVADDIALAQIATQQEAVRRLSQSGPSVGAVPAEVAAVEAVVAADAVVPVAVEAAEVVATTGVLAEESPFELVPPPELVAAVADEVAAAVAVEQTERAMEMAAAAEDVAAAAAAASAAATAAAVATTAASADPYAAYLSQPFGAADPSAASGLAADPYSADPYAAFGAQMAAAADASAVARDGMGYDRLVPSPPVDQYAAGAAVDVAAAAVDVAAAAADPFGAFGSPYGGGDPMAAVADAGMLAADMMGADASAPPADDSLAAVLALAGAYDVGA